MAGTISWSVKDPRQRMRNDHLAGLGRRHGDAEREGPGVSGRGAPGSG
jgi:hypothetical protein